MDDNAQYITLLVVAIGLTFLVGRLLVTAGEPFLQEVFQDRSVTRSVNLLLSVLFHLITLGVLGLISGIDLGPADPLQRFVTRLGVVLLILGIAYGVSMLVLIRIRERRRSATISEHVQERLAERGIDTRPPGDIPHQQAGQPMAQPVSQPVAQQPVQPVDQQAAQPVSQPAAQPVSRPAVPPPARPRTPNEY